MAIAIKKQRTKKEEQRTITIGKDIRMSIADHDMLLKHCITRLDWAKDKRDARIARYTSIDKEVAGFQVLSTDDQQRKKDIETGKGIKPYNTSLPMAKTQMDEAVTFLLTVFFPEEGAYQAVAPEDKQSVAKGLSTLMNQHSSDFGHYANFGKFLLDGMKYNLGLISPEWINVHGATISNSLAKEPEIKKEQLVNQGNKLFYLDPYNTFMDPSVAPVDVCKDGEFFAYVEPVSTFRAKRMAANKELYNTTGLTFDAKATVEMEYYEEKPDINGDAVSHGGQTINWIKWWGGSSGDTTTAIGAYELIHMYIWVHEKEMKLGQTEQFAIYRITILNGERIVDVEKQTNAHGLLPMNAFRPWDDNFDDQTQSFAELLLPFQRFSSFQMNVHQHAARKALYGIILFNKRLFPELDANDDIDFTACKIPFDSIQEIEDIRKHFLQLTDAPDTANTIRDIENMDALMQKVLPTDMLKQVTDLQRATQYQSAATVQSANRRNLKIANICESQAFYLCRSMQVYNIMQYQEDVEIFDQSGKQVKVSPAEFRDTKLGFIIGAGLRGLDKLTLIETMKEILAYIVQNQHASAQIDVVAMINYITTLIGDYTNFAQFKFDNEFDKLPPEQKQQAFELLQQATIAQQDEQQNGDVNAQ